MRFEPFKDDVASLTVSGFTLENGTDRIAIHGCLDVTADRVGLRRIEELVEALSIVRDDLAARPGLAERVPDIDPTAVTVIKNPFGADPA